MEKFVDNSRSSKPQGTVFDHILVGGCLARLVSESDYLVPAKLTADGYDIHPSSLQTFLGYLRQAQTIVFNGPLGRFEDGHHYHATQAVLEAMSHSSAFTVIGGGDTLSALDSLGFKSSQFSFVSTGGGAMLEYLATLNHPLLSSLKKRYT